MGVVDFIPKKGISPIFGIKLAPVLSRACVSLKEIEAELVIKKALNINEHRAIQIKEVEDNNGISFSVLIVYDYLQKKNKPPLSIPQTPEGFFDFPIYNFDFNTNINIENIITQGILENKKHF